LGDRASGNPTRKRLKKGGDIASEGNELQRGGGELGMRANPRTDQPPF